MSREILEGMLNKTREEELKNYKKQRTAELIGNALGRIAAFTIDVGACWLALKFLVGLEISFLATFGWGIAISIALYRVSRHS